MVNGKFQLYSTIQIYIIIILIFSYEYNKHWFLLYFALLEHLKCKLLKQNELYSSFFCFFLTQTNFILLTTNFTGIQPFLPQDGLLYTYNSSL